MGESASGLTWLRILGGVLGYLICIRVDSEAAFARTYRWAADPVVSERKGYVFWLSGNRVVVGKWKSIVIDEDLATALERLHVCRAEWS